MDDLNSLVETLSNLTSQESGQLAQIVRRSWNIREDLPAASIPSILPAEAIKPEQTEFSLTLVNFGEKKLEVIKVVRGLMNIPLKEAKDFVEAAPTVLKTDLSKADSEEWKKKIEEVGGKVGIH